MSLHRESVTWQSEDGTWSMGIFHEGANLAKTLPMSEDPCHDVFLWVSCGHTSAQSAYDAWLGADAAEGEIISFSDESRALCDHYDVMAEIHLERQTGLYRLPRPRI